MSTSENVPLPPASIFLHAAKLAITEDKQIAMDYWLDSINDAVIIGVEMNNDSNKKLVKNSEEYTSIIQNIYKIEDNYIIETENTIYIIKSSIKKKRIHFEKKR